LEKSDLSAIPTQKRSKEDLRAGVRLRYNDNIPPTFLGSLVVCDYKNSGICALRVELKAPQQDESQH
jgi:hypothetical protein